MAPPRCWTCQIRARSGWASEGGSRMGDFLLGFGLLPYACPCAGRVLARSLPPSSPPASRARCPSSQNFRGQGLSSASVALHHRLMDSCHSFALLATTSAPGAPARLSGGQQFSSVHTEPIHLVNINTVQHGVYGGFAWRQVSASKGQSP